MIETKILTKEEKEKLDREWKEIVEAAVRWVEKGGKVDETNRKRGIFG